MDVLHDLTRADLTHAKMVSQPTYRLVARPAIELSVGLHDGGEWIERCPVPRTGWPENSDRGCAERGGDMQQAGVVRHRNVRGGQRENGVAQVGPGEVARAGESGNDLRGQCLLARTADDPGLDPVDAERRRQ